MLDFSSHPKVAGAFRAALIAVMVAAVIPVVCARGFDPRAAHNLAFVALVAVFGGLMWWGSDLCERWLPRHWGWPYFSMHLLVFATVLGLPVPRYTAWLLVMPVVSQAAATLPWLGVVAVAAGELAVFGVFLFRVGGSWPNIVSSVTSLGVGVGFTIACTALAGWANRSREKAERLARELEVANAELRAASERTAELAAATERNRIARDIHDGLGHYLTVVAVQVQAARALLAEQPARAGDALARAEESARAALDAVRRSVGALRENAGRPTLRAAIGGLVQESGGAVVFECVGMVATLAEPAEQALFRTVQEALTNVRKHAGPSRVTVRLDYGVAGRVAVEIVDDGRGAAAPASTGGYGLAGLRERLEAVGGTLQAGPGEHGGFRVRAEVPA